MTPAELRIMVAEKACTDPLEHCDFLAILEVLPQLPAAQRLPIIECRYRQYKCQAKIIHFTTEFFDVQLGYGRIF